MQQIYPQAGSNRTIQVFKTFCAPLLILCLLSISKTNAQVGTNLSYDGTDDYLLIPAEATKSIVSNVTGDFTIEAWVLWNGGNNSFPRILDFGNDQNNWIVLTAANPFGFMGPRFMIHEPAGDQLVDASAPLTPGTWNHIAVTLDASTNTLTMYINGQASASTGGFTFRLSDIGITANNWLGQSEYPGDPYFSGNIEELRISNNVRYTANFDPVPTVQFTPDANTVALYHFNEGGGQTTADATGNNPDGILGGTLAIESSDPTWVFGSVLPVKLTDFSVTLNNVTKTVDVKWTASTDEPTEFTIERSSNGSAFARINTVTRTTATSGLESFSFRDLHPLGGRSYYRLKYSESDKPALYSRTIPVNVVAKGGLVVYPNPVKGGMINIELLNAFTGHVQIRLLNSAGAIVARLTREAVKEREFHLSRAGLPAGSYILEIITGDLKQSQILVCQ